jgi:UDP-galactopyranose mutase
MNGFEEKKVDYLILGAGVAGLGVSIALEKRGKKSLVLEKDGVPGGLNRSETIQGCGFDFGPKILILDNSENSQEILGFLEGNYKKYPMQESVWLKNYGLVGFPLQRYLVDLPGEIRSKIIESVRRVREHPRQVNSFKDWLVNCFGEYFANWIMIPYEQKKWQVSLNKMDYEWVKSRPLNISLEEMIEGSKRKLPPDRFYYYPKYGRIDSLTFAMAREAGEICYNNRVGIIGLTDHLVFTDNCRYEYKYLISTLPLDSMAGSCYVEKGCLRRPEELVRNLQSFRRLGLYVFNLVFEGNYDLKGTAIYFPEKDYIFRRVSVLQNLCPALRRKGKTPISVEVSVKSEKTKLYYLWEEKVLEKVLRDLKKIPQFAQMGSPIASKVHSIDFAYPLQINGLAQVKKEVTDFLRKFDVYVCGRGGNFEYCNSDIAYKQGKELGQSL